MKAEDPNAVIGQCAEDGSSSLCFETMKLFASAYGAETGNIALKVLATGGMYLGGGIAPKSLKTLQSGFFIAGLPRQRPPLTAPPIHPRPRNPRRHLRPPRSSRLRRSPRIPKSSSTTIVMQLSSFAAAEDLPLLLTFPNASRTSSSLTCEKSS